MIESHVVVEPELLKEIGLMVISGTLMAHLTRFLKQPLIIGYILAGIIIGPAGLGLITNTETIRTLSELGIAFLLFIVGMELDLQRLASVGLASTVTALVNAVVMFILGFGLSHLLGFTGLPAIYMGLILGLSSTMVVIKLLSDKNELETLHGRIILGILMVQDVIAVLALSILSTMEGMTSLSMVPFESIINALVLGAGMFSIALVASKFILPSLFHLISNRHELLFATALSVFFIFTGIASLINFSIAVGAFMAGLAIATFPYNMEIEWRIRSLRDFFLILFFVSLGMEIWFGAILETIIYSIPFIVVVLLIKPLLLMLCTSLFRYGRRISFLTASGLAQISEFSLIIAMTGLSLGHIEPRLFSIVAVVSVITFVLTGYMIKYDDKIYAVISERLWLLESMSHHEKKLDHSPDEISDHAVLVGCHRMGYSVLKVFEDLDMDYVVMDFNPDIVKLLAEEGRPALYGDVGDVDALKKLNLESADLVVSTVDNEEDNLLLLQEVKDNNPKATVFLTANTVRQALKLYDSGADYVLIPKILSGLITSDLVEEHVRKPEQLEQLRESHIRELEEIAKEELLQRYEPSFLKHLERKIGHFRTPAEGEEGIRVVIERKED